METYIDGFVQELQCVSNGVTAVFQWASDKYFDPSLGQKRPRNLVLMGQFFTHTLKIEKMAKNLQNSQL